MQKRYISARLAKSLSLICRMMPISLWNAFLGPDTADSTIICDEPPRQAGRLAGQAQVKVARFACKVQQSIASYITPARLNPTPEATNGAQKPSTLNWPRECPLYGM